MTHLVFRVQTLQKRCQQMAERLNKEGAVSEKGYVPRWANEEALSTIGQDGWHGFDEIRTLAIWTHRSRSVGS